MFLSLRLLSAVSPPEMAAVAEAELEEEEEEEEEEASHGARDTDALKTGEGELPLLLPFIPPPPPPPSPKLSTPTLSPNSALIGPSGLRHPCAKSGSSEKAGPGNPAPQGQVSGSVSSGEESDDAHV